MKNLKTFEDFINTGKVIKEEAIVSRKASAKFSDVVSKKTQDKLYEVLSEAMNEAIAYENDNDPEHTL